MIGKLEKRHAVHIAGYGEGNERRLTGKHETSSMDAFRCHTAHPLLHHLPRGIHPKLEKEILYKPCRA